MPQAVAAFAVFLIEVGVPAALVTFTANVFVYASAAYLLNRAAKALAPKPRGAGLGSGAEINYYDTGASVRIAYGRVRTGGMETIPPLTHGQDSRYLHKVLTLVGHEVDSFNFVHFDTNTIEISALTAMSFSTSDGKVNSGPFRDRAWIRNYRGTSTDSADRILCGVDSAAFGNSRARGIAKAAIQLQFDDKVYQSTPTITFTYQGKRCYDPRLDTTPGANPTNASYIAWTQNPALCLVDYLMATYGGEYTSAEIDWDTVVTAANYCDGVVSGIGTTYSASTADIEISGSTITKTGGAGAWTEGAITSDRGFRTVELEWSPGQTNGYVFIGLTASAHIADTQDYPRVDFAWHVRPVGTGGFDDIAIYERGSDTMVGSFGGVYTTSTVFRISYDGINVRYYMDDVLQRTTYAPGLTLYLDALIGTVGASATLSTFGPSQPRYTCNGVLFAAESFEENVKALTDAMLGRVIFRDGKWRIFAGSWQTPTFTIQKEDWISGLSIRFEQGRRKRFNQMKCFYVDRERDYQRVECNPRFNTTYRAADGNESIEAETEQLLCDNEAEAQRKAEFLLRQSRNQIIVSGRLPPRFQNIALWDTGTIVFDHLGWSSKTFRCVGIDMNPDGAMDCVFAEEQSSDWTDLTSSEYNQPSTATLPEINVTNPSAPSSLAITQNTVAGTLRFSIGDPIVKPFGTQFAISRKTTSTPDSGETIPGTEIWRGVANVVDLVVPSSAHYYWATAVANSAYSPYYPTSGNAGVPGVPIAMGAGDSNNPVIKILHAFTNTLTFGNGGAQVNSLLVIPAHTTTYTLQLLATAKCWHGASAPHSGSAYLFVRSTSLSVFESSNRILVPTVTADQAGIVSPITLHHKTYVPPNEEVSVDLLCDWSNELNVSKMSIFEASITGYATP